MEMPAAYAHDRLGREIKKRVRAQECAVIEKHWDLFTIGLQGPDILFHYKPLRKNQVKELGHRTHDRPGRAFFEQAARVMRENGGTQQHLAYLYGFLCHFALDVTCHGYVDETIAASGVSHVEIETEFDRMLMLRDGHDPIRHLVMAHMVPSRESAAVIAPFFEGVSGEQIQKALNGMIRDGKWMRAPGEGKRKMLRAAFRLTGTYEEMHGLIVNREENPLCRDSTQRLWTLYQEAVCLGTRLIEEYSAYLAGEGALGSVYDFNFGSKLVEATHH